MKENHPLFEEARLMDKETRNRRWRRRGIMLLWSVVIIVGVAWSITYLSNLIATSVARSGLVNTIDKKGLKHIFDRVYYGKDAMDKKKGQRKQ